MALLVSINLCTIGFCLRSVFKALANEGRNMFCMSEHEEHEQLLKLVLELNEVKGHLQNVDVKLAKAFEDWKALGDPNNATRISIENGIPVVSQYPSNRHIVLDGLLNATDFVEVLSMRDQLKEQVATLTGRLKLLAPNLLS
jgi:hypothetical protein